MKSQIHFENFQIFYTFQILITLSIIIRLLPYLHRDLQMLPPTSSKNFRKIGGGPIFGKFRGHPLTLAVIIRIAPNLHQRLLMVPPTSSKIFGQIGGGQMLKILGV